MNHPTIGESSSSAGLLLFPIFILSFAFFRTDRRLALAGFGVLLLLLRLVLGRRWAGFPRPWSRWSDPHSWRCQSPTVFDVGRGLGRARPRAERRVEKVFAVKDDRRVFGNAAKNLAKWLNPVQVTVAAQVCEGDNTPQSACRRSKEVVLLRLTTVIPRSSVRELSHSCILPDAHECAFFRPMKSVQVGAVARSTSPSE